MCRTAPPSPSPHPQRGPSSPPGPAAGRGGRARPGARARTAAASRWPTRPPALGDRAALGPPQQERQRGGGQRVGVDRGHDAGRRGVVADHDVDELRPGDGARSAGVPLPAPRRPPRPVVGERAGGVAVTRGRTASRSTTTAPRRRQRRQLARPTTVDASSTSRASAIVAIAAPYPPSRTAGDDTGPVPYRDDGGRLPWRGAAAAWIRSGAAALTGRPDGPGLVPPAPVLGRIARLGEAAGADPWATLTERAAVAGLRRQGAVSCGGGTRLLRAADGWLAASLVRPEDVDAVAAWLEIDAACPSAPSRGPRSSPRRRAAPVPRPRRPGPRCSACRWRRSANGGRAIGGGDVGRRRPARAGGSISARPDAPTPVRAARRGPVVAVGRAAVRPPAGRLRGRPWSRSSRHPPRRRPPRPGAVLRPPPQRAAGGGARPVSAGDGMRCGICSAQPTS